MFSPQKRQTVSTKSKIVFVHPGQHCRHLQAPRQARYVYAIKRADHWNRQHSRHLQVPRQARYVYTKKDRSWEPKARSSLFNQDNIADLLYNKISRQASYVYTIIWAEPANHIPSLYREEQKTPLLFFILGFSLISAIWVFMIKSPNRILLFCLQIFCWYLGVGLTKSFWEYINRKLSAVCCAHWKSGKDSHSFSYRRNSVGFQHTSYFLVSRLLITKRFGVTSVQWASRRWTWWASKISTLWSRLTSSGNQVSVEFIFILFLVENIK